MEQISKPRIFFPLEEFNWLDWETEGTWKPNILSNSIFKSFDKIPLRGSFKRFLFSIIPVPKIFYRTRLCYKILKAGNDVLELP